METLAKEHSKKQETKAFLPFREKAAKYIQPFQKKVVPVEISVVR